VKESPEISRTYSSLGLTPKALERARATRVLVGFDGFVDEIVAPVAASRGPGEDYAPFASISQFAERIGAAGGGRNVNIEIVPRLEKLGGNGPILAHGLLALGCDVRYVGALGTPDSGFGNPANANKGSADHEVSELFRCQRTAI